MSSGALRPSLANRLYEVSKDPTVAHLPDPVAGIILEVILELQQRFAPIKSPVDRHLACLTLAKYLLADATSHALASRSEVELSNGGTHPES